MTHTTKAALDAAEKALNTIKPYISRVAWDSISADALRLIAEARKAEESPLPVTPDEPLAYILGLMPWNSRGYAEMLRHQGVEIPRKCEMEQAHAMLWMLRHYLKHGPEKWREIAGVEVQTWLDAVEEEKRKKAVLVDSTTPAPLEAMASVPEGDR